MPRNHLASPWAVLFTVVCATGAIDFAWGGVEEIERAVTDLGSPFLEVREDAARRLGEAGENAEERLAEVYGRADYRTKALILDAFASGRPTQGLPLVYGDLACRDRGVVNAQRRLVSAVYGEPRRFVLAEMIPRIPRGTWKLEEMLRALPSPCPSARRAVEVLRKARGMPLCRKAEEVSSFIEEVDRMRRRFRELGEETDPVAAGRARQMEERIARHDVERAFMAVITTRGLEGTYEGLFAIVGEIEVPGTKAVLLRILKDEASREAGVESEGGRPYDFLEPVSERPAWIREYAAQCLGEVGDEAVGAALAAYYETLPAISRTGVTLNPKDSVAYAAASLGEPAPLRELIDELQEILAGQALGDKYIPDYLVHSHLGQAYAKQGNVEQAVHHFLYSSMWGEGEAIAYYNVACVHSKAGRIEEALQDLVRAAREGYASDWSQVDWMERDGDLAAVRKAPGYRDLLRRIVRELPPRR